MTIVDSGPLVALMDRTDKYHAQCREAARGVSAPLITTLPALTEAMHFVGHRLGGHAQDRLWQLIGEGKLTVACQDAEQVARMAVLMRRYADIPMDFADASLVALAETTHEDTVFTIDEHFRAYRLPDRRVFRVVPAPG